MTHTSRLIPLMVGLAAHVSAAGEPLHVMAFNVLYKGADDAKSVKAIEDEDPEVLCLTELTPAFIKTFEASLAKTYPHRSFSPKTGTWGVGFASKRPLRDVVVLPVAPSKIPAMEATVTHDGKRVRLSCVHLVPPVGKYKKTDTLADQFRKNAEVREKQTKTLVTRYSSVKSPLILLGDFNEEPGGAALKVLSDAGFSRGCDQPKSSCSATFPGPANPWPAVFQVDHVFARGLSFVQARTLRAGGSDHFPVSASLGVEP